MKQNLELKNEFSYLSNNSPVNSENGTESLVIPQENIDFRYGFRLGEYGLLVPEAVQSEVIMNPDVYPIPNTVEWMKGLVRVRGKFALVFDLYAILDINGESQQDSILVMNIKEDLVAFSFDSVHSLELPESMAEEQLKLTDSISRFAGYIYQSERTFWIEFDFQTCMEQFAR